MKDVSVRCAHETVRRRGRSVKNGNTCYKQINPRNENMQMTPSNIQIFRPTRHPPKPRPFQCLPTHHVLIRICHTFPIAHLSRLTPPHHPDTIVPSALVMLRKRVPVIVPLHEIANAVATPRRTDSPPATPSQPSEPPHTAAVAIHVNHDLPPRMRPLRKNKRLRPVASGSASPRDRKVSRVDAKGGEGGDVNGGDDGIMPDVHGVRVSGRRRAERDKDASSASDSHGSTVCSPASSIAANEDLSTQALLKMCAVADQQNIVWTKIKGHPFWPAQHVRIHAGLEMQPRFKSAAKFRRRVDDTCVMYFGTCEIAYVNAEKACISWKEGITKNYHTSHKNRTVFQRALQEVKAFCHRNTRYPRGWWCEPPCMALAAQFRDLCVAPNLHKRLRPYSIRAEEGLIYWAKIRGFPNWPVQLLPRNMAADKYPQLKLSPDSSSTSSSMPCMFFGTGEVAMVAEKNMTPFGAGLTRGYVTNSDRQDFSVAIGEVWGYLQVPRIWPSGYLSGNLWWNYEEPKEKKTSDDSSSSDLHVPHLPAYEHIRKSVWLEGIEPPPKPKRSDISCCGCTHSGTETACVDSNCLNFASRFLCIPGTCLAGQHCGNIAFHRRKHPRFKPFFTADQRGWGLRVEENIKKGTFVTEYVGEIIDRDTLDTRLKDAQRQRSSEYYMMDLTNDLIVDAKFKGNWSRFINSSCEPNCATQKWTDSSSGQTHVGIFAIVDIPKGTELTYNYFFEDYGLAGKSQKRSFMCQCGTSSCCMLEAEEKKMMRELVGKRLEVRWDDGWYPGVVETYNFKKKRFRVQYDDGDCEDLVLGLTTAEDDGVAFRVVEEKKNSGGENKEDSKSR